MTTEIIKYGVDKIKDLAKLRIPNFEFPAYSFIEKALIEILDADRAQRAAPGVQGGEPTPWRNDMMDMAIAAGVAPNTIFHFEAAFLRFAESLEKKINTAQPPQQSAQPVAVATVVEELEHDGEGFCAKVRWLFNPVPVGEQLFWE